MPSCQCPPPPPPPFDVPPPPDPSLVFHLLSDDPSEALERFHLRHSCPFQQFGLDPLWSRLVHGQLLLPLASIGLLLLFVSLSITALTLRRRRRKMSSGSGRRREEGEERRRRKRTKMKEEAEEEEEGRTEGKRSGGKKKKKGKEKRRRRMRSNVPSGLPNGAFFVSPSACPQPPQHCSVSSPSSSDPSATAFSRRSSSTDTVSSAPSPPQPQQSAGGWVFLQPAGGGVPSPNTTGTGKSQHRHHSSSSVHHPPSFRTVALRFPPHSNGASSAFAWRIANPSGNGLNAFITTSGSDLYEEVATISAGGNYSGDIAEAPYKRRGPASASLVRRLPPPATRPPPPPFAVPFPGDCSPAEDKQLWNRPRTCSELVGDRRGRESGYGTGRSAGGHWPMRRDCAPSAGVGSPPRAVLPSPPADPANAIRPMLSIFPSPPLIDNPNNDREPQQHKAMTYM